MYETSTRKQGRHGPQQMCSWEIIWDRFLIHESAFRGHAIPFGWMSEGADKALWNLHRIFVFHFRKKALMCYNHEL
ncbi:hypothetical protein I532_00705 [Brevibacillus borstelensis AK1]|uniref:Uncharacterized protein n=1 Tax=Brevibacillus borstelensis AK1 TaxID=1300222 RepID=M8E474_9BACL|nr:hypothetical protein I532_00705 [Brevibacillus borstelensis AK1]